MKSEHNSRNERGVDVKHRYCSHHCALVPIEGGGWRPVNHGRGRGKGRRWICGQCLTRIQPPMRFVGTTGSTNYLKEETGDRRFWAVKL